MIPGTYGEFYATPQTGRPTYSCNQVLLLLRLVTQLFVRKSHEMSHSRVANHR